MSAGREIPGVMGGEKKGSQGSYGERGSVEDTLESRLTGQNIITCMYHVHAVYSHFPYWQHVCLVACGTSVLECAAGERVESGGGGERVRIMAPL